MQAHPITVQGQPLAGGAYPSSQLGRLCLQAASGHPKWMEPLALFGARWRLI